MESRIELSAKHQKEDADQIVRGFERILENKDTAAVLRYIFRILKEKNTLIRPTELETLVQVGKQEAHQELFAALMRVNPMAFGQLYLEEQEIENVRNAEISNLGK